MNDKKQYELNYTDTTISISKKEIDKLKKMPSGAADVIGQPRALHALKMGIGIRSGGYNIFVTGLSGTGKRTAIKKMLEEISREVNLKDITFVYNFKKPDSPKAISFPEGKGKVFKRDIHQLVENLKSSIRLKLESKRVQSKKERILRSLEHRENKMISDFETRLAKENFHIVQLEDGESQVTDITPVHDGQATDFDELQGLVAAGEITEAYFNKARERYYFFMDEMKKMFKELRRFRGEQEEKVRQIDIQSIEPLIASEIEGISANYDNPEVKEYLEDLKKDIHSNMFLFTIPPSELGSERSVSFSRYGVNVIVDNEGITKPPVIFENNPTPGTLLGTIETKVEMSGVVKSDFMMIRAGTLLQSSGGFLVLYAEELLRQEPSWQKLKNVLINSKTEIFQPEAGILITGNKLKPEPIKVDVKVIIIGSVGLYDMLYNLDSDFHKLFKISAEFDSVMKYNSENLGSYIAFINKITEDEKLKPVSSSGMGKIIEYSLRLAEEKDYLSTRFSLVADIIREADYWAGEMGKKNITDEVALRAIKERNYLFNMPEEKLSKLINTGEILINVTGSAIGKVNGLAVYDRGYYAFGRPTLITAQISPGDSGVVNIERESGLSGDFHDKGILILEGYIRSTYARDFPLSIAASICFEQSYSTVDGDSASSAEIYALLSAITEVPLAQNIAVTGSVNQMGEIQPIGGVTEKVEGFYSVCKEKGITGDQGVIIPRQNIRNLVLNEEVVGAIKNKKFHIYAISTINEGMEILTGIITGEKDEEGLFPENSLNRLVVDRLKEIALAVKDFGHQMEQEEKS